MTLDYQVLESIEADFDGMTWTFRIGAGNHVSGGYYAVLPTDMYSKLTGKLAHAEAILRTLIDKREALNDKERERVAHFFDPDPL